MGRESEKRIDICITESLGHTPETNNVVNQLYPKIKFLKNKKIFKDQNYHCSTCCSLPR